MSKVVFTIWALLLNCMGISIFKTCFPEPLEYDEHELFGPPVTSMLFSLGVYVIICKLDFYPTSFRKLFSPLMGLYEFLVTSFILDFTMTCIWTPIDNHIYTTLFRFLRKIIKRSMNDDTRALQNEYPMAIFCFIISGGFLLSALYAAGLINFTKYSDYSRNSFTDYLKSKMVVKVTSGLQEVNYNRCRENTTRKRTRGQKKTEFI